ncbi:MAG: DegT/DnrJ/EryC1/StrS family aminotransferase, partial [Saprospiraceae bacterium]
MKIPFFRFDQMHAPIREDLLQAAARVIDSGSYILGHEVRSFEEEFASFCGTQYAVGVGNGLEALHLALRVLGVGPGDEVIVPSNTY